MSKTITIQCPKHGEVEFPGVHDLGHGVHDVLPEMRGRSTQSTSASVIAVSSARHIAIGNRIMQSR